MESAKVFGQGAKVGESDKLNIDSIIARLLEGKGTAFRGFRFGVRALSSDGPSSG